MQHIEINQDVIKTEPYSNRERALGQLGDWWGDRLVARADEVKKLPFFDDISPTVGLRGWVALVAHWCHDNNALSVINETRGVIGRPELYSVSHGKDASDQIQIALGKKGGTYGKSHDGFSIFYLHEIPAEYGDDCKALERAENPGPLYGYNPESVHPVEYFRSPLISLLSSPWEPLSVDLSHDPARLRSLFRSTGLLRNLLVNEESDSFVNHLRRLEDEYRIATV